MSLYVKMCAGKIRYPDKRAAKDGIRSLCSSGKNHKSTLNAYPCHFCNTWHIGHNYNSYRDSPPPPVWATRPSP